MTEPRSTRTVGARLRAGSATADVTPDDPIPLSGYGFREGPFEGVHDPVYAKALVLDDGAATVAVVSLDLLNVSREFTASVRRAVAAADVPVDDIMLTATHTHAGPYLPARTLEVSPYLSVEQDVSEAVDGYREGVVESITRAYERLEPASVSVGRATEDEVQHNRRASGGVGGNVRVPHGEVDPEVTALVVKTASGDETVVFNFACHPVCTNPREYQVSADWPGYACRRVAEERGGARVLFLNGAAGDINPKGSSDPRESDEVYEYMERVGTAVGETVLEAAEAADDARVVTRPQVTTTRREVEFPVKRTPPAEQLAARRADLEAQLADLEAAGDETGYEKVEWDWRYVEFLEALSEWDAASLPSELQYVSIGGVGLLGMPGEILVRHGLDLKERARAETLVPVGYANGYVSYIPTLADLENVGYEVRVMRVAPEAIPLFREAAFDLVS